MINQTRFLFLLACFCLSFTALTQNVSLRTFEKFTGFEWTGHYIGSSDSNLVHKATWEMILDQHVVKETKSVPELNFLMETFYFQDFENDCISFLSFANKELISRGKVNFENNKINLAGETFYHGGSSEFKKSYELADGVRLIDIFFRKTSEGFAQGHIIEYERVFSP